MNEAPALEEPLRAALARRASLVADLAAAHTDCYRVFHGTNEGHAGLTIDRYGDLLLAQSFHMPLLDEEVARVVSILDESFPGLDVVYNDRSSAESRVRNGLEGDALAIAERDRIACEHGVRFHIRARHRGQDPWLFLDMRPVRRAVMDEAEGKSLLNLFAYTCGVGVAAARAGASRVLNVDFARSSLDVGTANADLNGVADRCRDVASDAFPAIRQLAGIRQAPVQRGRRLPPFPHIKPETFDIVFLDPPRFATSPFGVVDLQRDYQSLFKPVLGTVADGGVLYCTNNVAQVDEEEWHSVLRRCADKHGRSIRNLDV
ncbi:MAG: 23S rRNA (cytosine1962-C5)-methyltransferase, partial [Hyphomicrobiaceae bacterium]